MTQQYNRDIFIRNTSIDGVFEQKQLIEKCYNAANGAVSSFTGLARGYNEKGEVEKIYIEQYEKMTQKSIETITENAMDRFSVDYCRIVHRYGYVEAGGIIVFVGSIATHRREAFQAVEFIMDHLKTTAPFWKKEMGSFGELWVDAKQADYQAKKKW